MEECLGTGTDVSQDCAFRETVSAQALQQRFCHHPQCAVELNIGVDAVNGTGVDTFPSGTATGNSAFQHILLNGLISTPQVLTVILPASWRQNVGGGDGLIGTCRLNNVEPEKWLRYVIEHIQDWPANRVRDLLPWKVDLTSQ
ncbi:TPA: transposase domain-containing protein [Escherichia coli]|nr:transposase domain-containing protein [Escherichia coli]